MPVNISEDPNDLIRYRLTREDIALLIANKNAKRKINCHVIEGDNPCSLPNFLDNLINSGQKRTQLLFKIAQGEHWSVMDIHRDKKGMLTIFFLDAIGHKHNLKPLLAFAKSKKVEVTTSMGELQKDNSSCSIFSTDHAFHMSKIANLHKQISKLRKQDPKNKLRFHIDPIDLPPALVKNVQSVSFLRKYLQKHPEHENTIINKKGQTLKKYAESHHVQTEEGIIAGAIQYKQQQYRTKINLIKGHQADPKYQEKMRLHAQNTIALTIEKINDFSVCFDDTKSLAMNGKKFLKELKKISNSRQIDDAYTILKLKTPPKLLSDAVSEKQRQINKLTEILESSIKEMNNFQVCFDGINTLKMTHSTLLAQLKTISDSQELNDALIALKVKAPPKILSDAITKKEAQINRLTGLINIGFDEHLVSFTTKNKEFALKATKDPAYTKAASKTKEFCDALQAGINKFLHSDNEQSIKENLYQDCKSAITDASKTLHDHREWLGALKKFLIDVLSFLSRGLTDSKLGIFAKTDSGKKIDAFAVDVESRLNPMTA